MVIDLYKILGVDRNTTQEEIKKAYREKAKGSHTDKKGGVGSDEEMALINRAYEVLKNPVRRKHYDETGEEKDIAFEQKFQDLIVSIFLMIVEKMDVEKEDLVAIFQANLQEILTLNRKALKSFDDAILKLEKVEKRVKVKKGENLILDIITKKLFDTREQKVAAEKNIKFFEEAVEYAQHYSYDVDQTTVTWSDYYLTSPR